MIFDNVTKLTNDFLKNEVGAETGLSPSFEEVKFKEYYINICGFINENFYLKPTTEQIEEFIKNGSYKYSDKITVKSKVKEAEARKYLFLMAQAKQFLYDKIGGRGAMIRGEDGAYDSCRDMVTYIKMLGLYQRTYCTV